MKPLTKTALILAFVLAMLPSYAGIQPVTLPIGMTNDIETNRINNRLLEIKLMDKSTLTGTEKRALRDEIKEIKRVKSSNGGVYLSVGAIIIIILLLIILL